MQRILVLTVVVVLLGGAGLAFAQTPERVDRVSSSGFEKTVKQLETALKGCGMMVVATLDHQNMLRMVGVIMRGSKTLEFGKPDMMKAMSTHPEVGLEMPLKIYVYERGCPRSTQGGVDSMAEQLRHYDLVIIGTGSAASAAAFRCRAAGWRVAVIDSRPFGGTCALRGCHPKKMLVSAAEVLDATARMAGKGVRTHERDHPKICPCDFHVRDIQQDGFCLCTLFGNAQFGREGARVDVATLLVDNEAIARARQQTIVAYGSHW